MSLARPSARRRKTRSRRKRSRKGKQKLLGWLRPSWAGLRRAAWISGLIAFVLGFFLASSALRLDRIVRERFAGKIFQVPSRVLSAPTYLYPGLDWKHIDLPGTLARLGYSAERSAQGLQPGRFVWGEDSARIYLRAFEHPTRAEPSRDVRLSFQGSRIQEIRDMAKGRELSAVLLEPELVGLYYGPHRKQQELVHIEEVPDSLIDAVLAVEDQRFLDHHGIDPKRIMGAFLANLRAGRIRQGASTLTQQLVKNFFLTPERTYRRKAQEAIMALIVEARYDKLSILEAYFNEVYMGRRGSTSIHGMGEASRFYFGKRVDQLQVEEAALLAAVIQGPNALSPFRWPDRALARRNLVLGLMRGQGKLGEPEHDEAVAMPLRLAYASPEPEDSRYFLDLLRAQLPDVYTQDELAAEGLRVYSTLDVRLQTLAAKSLRSGLERLEKSRPELLGEDGERGLQGCVIVLQPQTGEVLALVGGRDYRKSQFNRCTQARRQAGSIFKPFAYLAALEPGRGGPVITLADRLDDSPLEIPIPGEEPWRPQNYDREFRGSVSVREALERSLNVATARLGQQVGAAKIADAAHRLGIDSPLPEVPSLPLGVADVSPLEIARAYATIANAGVRPAIRSFDDVVSPDSEGSPLVRREIAFERVVDRGAAFLTTSLLEGVVDRGTGRAARLAGLNGPFAGKTGTSDGLRDAWFAGFTPELVVVVWVGFDEPESIGLTGSQGALPIWIDFMKGATGGRVRGAFMIPPDVERVAVDPVSGARALAGCPARVPEYFLEGTVPTRTCPEWGEDGRPESGGDGLRGFLRRLFGGGK